MLQHTNIKFYVLCRAELDEPVKQIHEEIKKLFDKKFVPSFSTTQKWVKDYKNATTPLNKHLMLKYNEKVTKYDRLKFKIDKSQTNRIQKIQFFALCRYQLNEKPTAIILETIALFDSRAPDLIMLNTWILNLWKEDFKVKSIEMEVEVEKPTESNTSHKSLKLNVRRLRSQSSNHQELENKQSVSNVKEEDFHRNKILTQLKEDNLNLKQNNDDLTKELSFSKQRVFELEDKVANLAKYNDNSAVNPSSIQLVKITKSNSENNEIQLLNQENQTLKQEITELISNEISSRKDSVLCNKIIDLEREIENLRKKNTCLERKCSEITTDHNTMFANLKLSTAYSEQSKKRLEVQCLNQLNLISRLELELNELKNPYTDIQMFNSDFIEKDPLNSINVEELLNFDIELVQNQKIKSLEEALAVLKEDHELEVKDLNSRIQLYIQERNDFRLKYEFQTKNVQNLFASHQNLLEAVVKETITSSESEKYFEEIKIAVQNQNLERKQLKNCKIKIKDLEYEIGSLEMIIKQQKSIIDKLNFSLISKDSYADNLYVKLKKEYKELETKNSKLNDDISKLEKDYLYMRSQNKILEINLVKLERKIDKFKENNHFYSDELKYVENDLKDKSNECFKLKHEIKLLKKQNEALNQVGKYFSKVASEYQENSNDEPILPKKIETSKRKLSEEETHDLDVSKKSCLN